MKLILLTVMVFSVWQTTAQNDSFLLKGKIVDMHSKPVADAYIINYSDFKKNVSDKSGEFNIWVHHSDSLMVSHISYYRKVVYADSVRLNPLIHLKLDTINILHVNIFTEPRDDETFARENIDSWKFSVKPLPTEAFTEKERVQNVMNSENKVMRSAASSVRIVSFSPSEQIGKLFNLLKRREKSKK